MKFQSSLLFGVVFCATILITDAAAPKRIRKITTTSKTTVINEAEPEQPEPEPNFQAEPPIQPSGPSLKPLPQKSECFNVPDGNFPRGLCQSEYYSCVAHEVIERKCSGSLIFDPDHNDCTSKQLSRGCTGRDRAEILAESTLQSVVNSSPKPDIGFDCSDKSDDFFPNPNQPCDSIYFVCNGGIGNKMKCPWPLNFDTTLKICDAASEIEACTGIPRKLSTLKSNADEEMTTINPKNEAKTFPPVPFDCEGLDDKNYPDPAANPKNCNGIYFSCNSNQAKQMECPQGLFFDPDANLCEAKDFVPVCGGVARTTPCADLKIAKTVNFDCLSLMDGVYADPEEQCSEKYFSCSGNVANELQCQPGLIFDLKSISCQLRESLFQCTGVEVTFPESSTVVSSAAPTFPPLSFDCRDKVEGSYADPDKTCNSDFFICSNGVTMLIHCPPNLFFDDELKSCGQFEEIFGCSGKRATTPEPTSTTVASTLPPVDFECRFRPNQAFGDDVTPCSQRYFVCANGLAYERFCPSNLFYDPQGGTCASKDDIVLCGGGKSTTTTTTEPTTTILTTPRPPPLFDCSEKLDGLYADHRRQCSSDYFSCANKIDRLITCPQDLFFDPEKKVCNRFVSIFVCSGLKPADQEPIETTSSKVIAVATLEPVDFDCKGKLDDFYSNPAEPCSQAYFTCSGGLARKGYCVLNTFFDNEAKLCDVKSNIVACGGQRVKQIESPNPEPSATKVNFDCSKLQSGYYEAGPCENFYFSCVGHFAQKLECPSGLIYDLEKKVCDSVGFIPKCGGQRLTSPSVPDSEVVPASTEPPVQSALQIDCKEDGKFADPENPCSSQFYSCKHGIARKLDCPSNLVYNARKQKCDVRENIAACADENKYKSSKKVKREIPDFVLDFDPTGLNESEFGILNSSIPSVNFSANFTTSSTISIRKQPILLWDNDKLANSSQNNFTSLWSRMKRQNSDLLLDFDPTGISLSELLLLENLTSNNLLNSTVNISLSSLNGSKLGKSAGQNASFLLWHLFRAGNLSHFGLNSSASIVNFSRSSNFTTNRANFSNQNRLFGDFDPDFIDIEDILENMNFGNFFWKRESDAVRSIFANLFNLTKSNDSNQSWHSANSSFERANFDHVIKNDTNSTSKVHLPIFGFLKMSDLYFISNLLENYSSSLENMENHELLALMKLFKKWVSEAGKMNETRIKEMTQELRNTSLQFHSIPEEKLVLMIEKFQSHPKLWRSLVDVVNQTHYENGSLILSSDHHANLSSVWAGNKWNNLTLLGSKVNEKK